MFVSDFWESEKAKTQNPETETDYTPKSEPHLPAETKNIVFSCKLWH